MKKILLVALVIVSQIALAGEVTIHEANLRPIQFRPSIDASFQMNQNTGEGFVKISVTEERMTMGGYYDHMGRYYPRPFPSQFLVYQDTVRVEGLVLMDKKVIYHGDEGDVECGTLGVSRVLKVPTIFLTGNCKLEGHLTGGRLEPKLTVVLKTK